MTWHGIINVKVLKVLHAKDHRPAAGRAHVWLLDRKRNTLCVGCRNLDRPQENAIVDGSLLHEQITSNSGSRRRRHAKKTSGHSAKAAHRPTKRLNVLVAATQSTSFTSGTYRAESIEKEGVGAPDSRAPEGCHRRGGGSAFERAGSKLHGYGNGKASPKRDQVCFQAIWTEEIGRRLKMLEIHNRGVLV